MFCNMFSSVYSQEVQSSKSMDYVASNSKFKLRLPTSDLQIVPDQIMLKENTNLIHTFS